ncbi:MAG TPA: GDSL-type esterase/lipase family protein [Opitutaceae bacterium]|nr:GDSL-type esterase/lipase family protein [Opitutaceae bacterium]
MKYLIRTFSFRRMFALGAAIALALTCAAQPTSVVPSADWAEDMATFRAADLAHKSPDGSVLFLGSSSIRLWKTLAADFPGVAVINRGFGGSHIVDAIVHFDDLVLPHRPRLIVFYAGSNDVTSGKSPEQVAADFREFRSRVAEVLPETRILFISAQMAPARWEIREKFAITNAYVAAFCAADERLVFVDMNPHVLTPDGAPRTELYSPDMLHMGPEGYALWRRILEPLVR